MASPLWPVSVKGVCLVGGEVVLLRNERDEWELSEAGEQWAEAMPFSRNGHSGYQILWNPAVAEQLKEVA